MGTDAPSRPLLVYDGDCGFCVRSVARLRRLTRGALDDEPSQSAAPRFAHVPPVDFARAVFLFEPDPQTPGGLRTSRAAEAVFRALAVRPAWRWTWWLYRGAPGVRPLTEAAYDWVARHRDLVLRLDRALCGDVLASRWEASRALFRRGLALVALMAFLSLWVQLDGLLGARGLAPAAQAFEGDPLADDGFGPAWSWSPSLLWLGAGDAALHGLCAAGVLLALLLLLDITPALCALMLWATYLSLVQGGGPFLSFQWDSLLIETLALAALWLPWRLRSARPGDAAPTAAGRWLLWWLVFRFHVESGVVKLSWGDPTWPALTAMDFHYWTQPLPHALSWLAARLPHWLQAGSCAASLVVEIGVPFLLLAPRRVRHAACGALVLLQVLIGATGNYGFFNLLTIVLCLTLLDDDALEAWRPARWRLPWRRRVTAPDASAPAAGAACGLAGVALQPWTAEPRAPRAQRWLLAAAAVPALAVGALQLADSLAGPGGIGRLTAAQLQAGVLPTLLADGPAAAARVAQARQAPWLSLNAYGLFRVMTTTRPEIVVEVSADGEAWQEQAWRWKPGPPGEPPRWVQPHMPRLDWRLWFEALAWEPAALARRPYEPSDWFARLLQARLDGEPAVLELLGADPLQGRPARAVRATLFDYRFATAQERAQTGEAWVRRKSYLTWLTLRRDT